MSRDTDFQLNENDDDDEEVETWDGEGEWTADGEEIENDAKDESSAYLDFLNDQASYISPTARSLFLTKLSQAKKLSHQHQDEDDDLEEESMLETPLDKVEPYGIFKNTLFQLQTTQPQLYQNLSRHLSATDNQIMQNVIVHAQSLEQQQITAAATPGSPITTNGSTQWPAETLLSDAQIGLA